MDSKNIASHPATAGTGNVATHVHLLSLLETSLDHVLRALGLEKGVIWLHPHMVMRGLSEKVVEIRQAATQANLSIPHV